MVRDPLQLGGSDIALDMKLFPLLSLLDGRHHPHEIQIEMIRSQDGVLFPRSDLDDILNKLDRLFLLDSPHFRERLALVRNRFCAETVRPSAHAGTCYAADKGELESFIRAAEEECPPLVCAPGDSGEIAGILAPHIDIQVARKSYAYAYGHLKERRYDLAIVFGINHNHQEGLYCVSEKDYATPFGTMAADRAFIADLRKKVPAGTLSPDDFGHMVEHSIEFQAVFLRRLLGENCRIVPILCGSLHHVIFNGSDPLPGSPPDFLEDERFAGMARAVEEILNGRDRKALLVAGVDFSHVGLKFGDRMPAEAIVHRSGENDRKILAALEQADTAQILANAVETGDRYKVCGLPAMLIFSRLMRNCRGRLLSYDTYDERQTGSAVSYASMIFTREPAHSD